jgi:hypothetical protein
MFILLLFVALLIFLVYQGIKIFADSRIREYQRFRSSDQVYFQVTLPIGETDSGVPFKQLLAKLNSTIPGANQVSRGIRLSNLIRVMRNQAPLLPAPGFSIVNGCYPRNISPDDLSASGPGKSFAWVIAGPREQANTLPMNIRNLFKGSTVTELDADSPLLQAMNQAQRQYAADRGVRLTAEEQRTFTSEWDFNPSEVLTQ